MNDAVQAAPLALPPDPVQGMAVDIRGRARQLRTQSQFILGAIVFLLVGSLAILFLSQAMIISNSVAQSQAMAAVQGEIDSDTRTLTDSGAAFIRLRNDVAAAAAVAKPPAPVPFPTLRSVWFSADGRLGWAVGNAGAVLLTQDGGRNWQQAVSGSGRVLRSVIFAADAARGWAAAIMERF